jgi:hypothetical protein
VAPASARLFSLGYDASVTRMRKIPPATYGTWTPYAPARTPARAAPVGPPIITTILLDESTLPRRRRGTIRWRSVLTTTFCAVISAPVAIIMRAATQGLATSPSTRTATPTPTFPESNTVPGPNRLLRTEDASPPAVAPTAVAVSNKPKPKSGRPRTCLASSASIANWAEATTLLRQLIATSARRTRFPSHHRRPSAISVRTLLRGASDVASAVASGRIDRISTPLAAKDRALPANGRTCQTLNNAEPSGGPTKSSPLISAAAIRPFATDRCRGSRDTKSGTADWAARSKKTCPTPSRKATNTSHGRFTREVRIRITRAIRTANRPASAHTITRRRSSRSTTTPACSETSTHGISTATTTRLNATGLLVSWRTSSGNAAACMPVPVADTSVAPKSRWKRPPSSTLAWSGALVRTLDVSSGQASAGPGTRALMPAFRRQGPRRPQLIA